MKNFSLFFALCAGTFFSAHPADTGGTARTYNARHQQATPAAPSEETTPQKTPRTTKPQAKWTLCYFMQVANDLECYAYKRLNEIMAFGSTSEVNILVELHRFGETATRYRIEKNNCVPLQTIPRLANAKTADELIGFSKWALEEYPAEKIGLIFSGHGCGSLDPQWSCAQPYHHPHTAIRQIDPSNKTITPDKETPLSRATTKRIAENRGILFDQQRESYLDAQELRRALQTITIESNNKQPLEFLGMDACNMGQMEIARQCYGSAKTITFSQEYEYGPGWPHGEVVEKLTTRPSMSGAELGEIVVASYNEYWKSRTAYYTQSSLDLSLLPILKENIQQVVTDLFTCKKQAPEVIRGLVDQARTRCQAFSITEYIDLHSFYHELHWLLENYQKASSSQAAQANALPRIATKDLSQLRYSLKTGMQVIEKVVTKNATGRYLSRARGLSIYFPQHGISPCYLKTEFAKECLWLDFIYDHLKNRN